MAGCCSTSLLPQTTARLGRPATASSTSAASRSTPARKSGSETGIVEVAEHEVLPDEDPQLVAEIEERRRTRRRRFPTTRTMFIPASRTRWSRARSALGRRRHRDEVRGRPHRAPDPHRDAVDLQVEAVARDVLSPSPAPGTRFCGGRASRRRAPPTSSCSTGSPWVWGHHSAAPGTTSSVSASRARRARRRCEPRIPRQSPPAGTVRVTIPSLPTTRARTRSDASGSGAASDTGRHGPTGAGPGAKPGERPNIIVRYQRRLPALTTRVRQRALGRRRLASSGVSARQAMTSSLSARSRPATSTRWAANIDSDSRTSLPLR